MVVAFAVVVVVAFAVVVVVAVHQMFQRKHRIQIPIQRAAISSRRVS